MCVHAHLCIDVCNISEQICLPVQHLKTILYMRCMVRCCKLELKVFILTDTVWHLLNNFSSSLLANKHPCVKISLKHFFCHLVLLLNAQGQWRCILKVQRFTYLVKGYCTYKHFSFVCVYCCLLPFRSILSEYLGMYYVLCDIKSNVSYWIFLCNVCLLVKLWMRKGFDQRTPAVSMPLVNAQRFKN